MAEPGRPSSLQPGSQFPQDALDASVQKKPKITDGTEIPLSFTWILATSADQITPWGRDTQKRDRELRDFWPTESFLAGAVASTSFRNASLNWEIQGPTAIAKAVTDMFEAAISGDSIGWEPFMERFSQDLYTTDNGAFIELIRDPGTSKRFRNENAPVVGISNLDSNQCIRTGDPEYPVIYVDREGGKHKMKWYEVIPFSDYPSAIERMNGVGYCAVTRALRMAQIMKSIEVYKDEKVEGRHYKQIHFVSGVSRQEIKDEMARGQEEANNSGLVRFILPSILASLDPEKPVSTASIDLASLPDGFDLDTEMQWYIAGLALDFGVDYQEFAPLPGGNIGSSQQSMILHRKSSGKGPAVFMRKLAGGLKNYGAMPKTCKMSFQDKDEQEELEKQQVRTGAMEEMAIAVNSGVLSPEAAAKELVRRNIWPPEATVGLEEFWKMKLEEKKQPVGNRGGNTIVEDAGRQTTGKPDQKIGDRLRKAFDRGS